MHIKSMLCTVLAAVFLCLGDVHAQESSADENGRGLPPMFQHLAGADDVLATPSATNRYLFVPAAAFVRRSHTDSLINTGNGCIYTNGSTLNADLQLPAGAVIQGVRLYYYTPGAGDALRMWVTRYDGAGGMADLTSDITTQTGGYFNEYFAADPVVTIDPFSYSYALNARFTGADTRLCGMRVFYSY
jgi:hypothetical protein